MVGLPFLMKHVFVKQHWHRCLNKSALLQRRLLLVMASLLIAALSLPLVGYLVYILWSEVQSGVRENGFVWILQGVLVFAAAGFLLAKLSLLFCKPAEECPCHPRDFRQCHVDVFRNGLEFGIAGLLLGLAAGDLVAADEAAFAFGIFGIVLSIVGEAIGCFRRLRHQVDRQHKACTTGAGGH